LKTFFFPSGRRTYAGAELVISTVYTNRNPQSHIKKPQVKRFSSICPKTKRHTYHLFWSLELRLVNGRRERVQKFWPVRIMCQGRSASVWEVGVSATRVPPPYHVSSHNQSIAEHLEQKCLCDDACLSLEVPRSNTAWYTLSSPSSRRRTHPRAVSHCRALRGNQSYEISSFPLVIWSVSACAPRLIDPPTPPTLRQIEHIQS
jgi:hypothetical protein